MMSAILKVRPQIDQNDAKKMERSLFDRFKNIGKQAKKTLKDVVSGGFLGFALGLAQNMLSPIEEVETRIKAMLEKAGDLREIADEFNTSAGKLQVLQNNAMFSGLKPETLKAMMTSFKQAVDEAEDKIYRKEDLDEKSSLVKNFVGSTDMAQAFYSFIQELRLFKGPQRDSMEKLLFGNVQYGGAKRFIDNAGIVSSVTPNSNIEKVDKEIQKLSSLSDAYQLEQLMQQQKAQTDYAKTVNQGMINQMVAYEERQKAKELRDLQNYNELAAARLAIDKLNGIMETVTNLLTKAVGYLGQFIAWLEKSPAARGIMKTIGVR